MPILLDTNNLISGLLRKDGPSGELMRRWLDDEFRLVTSHYQLDELRRVMTYDRLRSKILPKEVTEFFDNVDAKAVIVREVPEVELSPDEADNPILATAIAGKADLIVSGDKGHMQILGRVEGIPIITPREAVERLGK